MPIRTSKVNGCRRAIGDFEIQTEVGKTHDSKADGPGATDHIVNLRERPGAGVDHIVQKPGAKMGNLTEPVPIDSMLSVIELRQIN